ncbi:MAG: cysteine--tRNA ligase [Synechococcaceae cyanobacterium]|nr:cysteine--tRNA ligase [Synechococcaceae cyanobacterium]
MTLRLTNTLTRTREEFIPLQDGQVKIYCCGVTVYDLCHVGHARSYVVWDVLRRYLTWRGYAVTFVQNFTDIDDKILARAARNGETMQQVSERNIAAYYQDMDALNILRPDRMPRATLCLDGIRAMIGELTERGAAYSSDGDVYFSVLRQSDYGKLSGRDLLAQREGAGGRVNEVEEARKRHPFDFALWKGAKPGEPSFPSPWGPGRPGWHIECSAMVRQELGETIDIHLGGADLIFPHHENEIAQSEAATGKPLARYWLHNGMVNVGGEKMAKTLGNFTTIRDLLARGTSPMTLRLFVLQAQYRKPLDFTSEGLEAAATGWKGLQAALNLGRSHGALLGWTPAPAAPPAAGPSAGLDAGLSASRERFIAAMDDDLNTSAALAELFELARPLRALANRLRVGEPPTAADRTARERWQLLQELAQVLGLEVEGERPDPAQTPGSAAAGAPQPQDHAQPGQVAGESPEDSAIAQLVEERRAAKAARDYAAADRIREQLRAQGIELIDRPGGETIWLRS